MKKSLTILTIAILAIVAFTSCVCAAEVKTSSTKVNVGDTVTVAVKTNNQFEGAEFTLKFDADKFQYAGASCVDANGEALSMENNISKAGNGEVFIQAYSGSLKSDTVVVTFKALKSTEGAAFNVEGLVLAGTDEEELSNNPATIAVETSENNNEGGTGNQGAGSQGGQQAGGSASGSSTSEAGSVTDKNGKKIEELPKTGTPIFAGAIALIVIAGAVLVIRNRK